MVQLGTRVPCSGMEERSPAARQEELLAAVQRQQVVWSNCSGRSGKCSQPNSAKQPTNMNIYAYMPFYRAGFNIKTLGSIEIVYEPSLFVKTSFPF